MKTCRSCLAPKPESEFYDDPECVGGKRHQCKTCQGAYASTYYRANPSPHPIPSVTEQTCPTCHQTKPDSQFYQDPRNASGLKSLCSDCQRAVSRTHGRLTSTRQHANKLYHMRMSDPAFRAIVNAKKREAFANFTPEQKSKHCARVRLGNAIKRGKIKRGPCEVCGTTEHVHGHHDDYSKPFDVRWLCKQHHGLQHRKF